MNIHKRQYDSTYVRIKNRTCHYLYIIMLLVSIIMLIIQHTNMLAYFMTNTASQKNMGLEAMRL